MKPMIQAHLVERDQFGFWTHPNYPDLADNCSSNEAQETLRRLGLELQTVFMESDVGGWFFWRGGAGGVGWLEARRGAGLGVFDRLAYTNRRMVWIARFQPDSEYLLALDRAGMRSQ